ncbi:hypothetical protein [Poriferisphaera sp. WC338]|uniref:hypothetical protein n=1 Tax=Poriferisphaera sp. WC338 TaxID=3425129 RepID=UPI003D8167E3
MNFVKYTAIGLFCISGFAVSASAQVSSQHSRVFTVRNQKARATLTVQNPGAYYPKYHEVAPDTLDESTQLVERRIVTPDATVSNGLAKQPVWPGMAEVRRGSITVFIDPNQARYGQRDRVNAGIDENNGLLKAQRLWRSLNNKQRVFVIRNEQASVDANGKRIQPRGVIYLKTPQKFKRLKPQKVQQKDDKILLQKAAVDAPSNDEG